LAGGVSTIGAVARYGPPDDFNNQPAQHAKFGMGGNPSSGGPPPPPPPVPQPPPDRFEPPESLDALDEDTEPTEWYRRPVVLIGWGLTVLILIALIVYGIIELIHGDQGTSHIPSTSTPSTAPPTATTTTTTPPPTTTTATTPPPTSSAVEPPPRQPTHQPTQQQPTHRHHLPPLPSVITIPEVPTVITLPPGLP
jgi:hypothetical protein